MKNIKMGMIGLGSIAQKAYLPILTKSERFEFVGAFTPNKVKREKICSDYRIMPFDSIESLAKKCDCIFLHSSTETHYEIIKILLNLCRQTSCFNSKSRRRTYRVKYEKKFKFNGWIQP